VPVLHAITNDVVLADPGFLLAARALMEAAGPRVAVHLRASQTPARALLERALELRVAAETTGSWVLVNDRLDVAMAAGATGVQLTSRSLGVADARRVTPTLVIGASVHEPAEAWLAAAAGADFVVAGHVYPTESHPGAPGRGEDFLRTIVAAADGVPVIAIGGITPERAAAVAAAGAHGVAAIRGIWFGDAPGAAKRYLAAHDLAGFR
jgi:thiamine-phosphate diphosphorylase